MSTHVDVTLVAAGRQVDLRVPRRITVHRLVQELAAIFPGIDAGLTRYQLRIRARGLVLTENDVLATGPVTTGDVLELVRGRTHAD